MSTSAFGNYAQLQNMGLCLELMMKAIHRPRHLPGFVVMHGYSGLGKSIAAAFTTAQTNALYIEARATWTPKYFLQQLALQLGFKPARTAPELLEQVVDGLAEQERPLIIDEADHVVTKKYIEYIRDIYELSRSAVMLIGEEHLPSKLKEWERVDNRVLAFAHARPASRQDGLQLRDLYCKKVEIADDLVEHFVTETRGIIRRIAVNLANAEEMALAEGWESLDLARWGNRDVFIGRADFARAA